MTNLTDMLSKFVNSNTSSTSGSGTLPSNTITNPKKERKPEVAKDTVPPTNNRSTKDVQPSVVQIQSQVPNSEPVVAPVSAPVPNLKMSIPFEISLTDALILMPKFASTLKALIGNKEKLSEMARTPLNEHCSAVILNKLPEKLVDPGKFLIPCDFPGMDECLALADLGASINLMPLSVRKKLSLSELTPTCMTLELVDRSITQPIGIAEDVDVKVGKFQFPADFVVVDFDADPWPPNSREILLKDRRYSSNYDDMTANRIDVIEMACEEYSLEVLGFSDVIASGNPTPYYDPIISTSSPTLTPFGDSDFILEEVDAFLALEDDPTSPEVDDSYYDPEGDILLLELFLNDDPSSPPPNQGNYLPEIRKELKVCEAKTDKSSIDELLEVELKDLPPHLILIEEDYNPAVQHQRWVNPKIYDAIKKEVEKLLDAGLIYLISDSPWDKKLLTSSQLAIVDLPGDITVPTTPPKKFLTQDFIGPQFAEMPMTWSPDVGHLVSSQEKFRNVMKCLKILSKFVKSLTCGASISWGHSRLHEGTNIYSWRSTTCQNGLKRKRSPPTTPELFANFLNLSFRGGVAPPGYGASRAILSDREEDPEESLGAPEDASKQGRSIEDIDADVDVSLVYETQVRQNDDLIFDTGVLVDVMPVEAVSILTDI
ncbi:reverse transcriptase domain-containing protein [Tanacetum coccineum]